MDSKSKFQDVTDAAVSPSIDDGRDGGDANGRVDEGAPPSSEGNGIGGEVLPMEQPPFRVDIAGAQPEQAPEAPTLVQANSSAILAVAPDVFKAVTRINGACAVVVGRIEREKLYLAEGFDSLKEYTKKKLGIRTDSAFKKLRLAADAVWEFYPERAEAVVAVLATGHARVHDLPHVPDQTTLSLLRRAYERTEPTERAVFLTRVLEEDFTTRELAARAKSKACESTQAAGVPEVGEEKARGDSVTATETVTNTEAPPPAVATDDGSPDLPEQDSVAQVIWRLAQNTRTLERLPPGEIGADLLASMCEQHEKFQKALEAHREAAHA